MTKEERKAKSLAEGLVKYIEKIEAALDVSPDILEVELMMTAHNKDAATKETVGVLIKWWNGDEDAEAKG